MPIAHSLLTLLIMVIWGINFIFIKLSLQEVSPLLLCTLRFVLASIPVIFFIKRPALPIMVLIIYGLIMFAMQFSFLFLGIHFGMTAGVTPLVMQVQVFMNMLLAAVFLREKPKTYQIYGALISFSGIALIAFFLNASVTFLGFSLILAAAMSWAIGNLLIKKYHTINMFAVVVWGSFVAIFPMVVLTFWLEGSSTIIASLHHMTWVGFNGLLYIAYISTLVGYGGWNWLLSRYPVTDIVAFTLLIPVIGMLAAIVFLDEALYPWKIVAGLLTLAGLALNLFGEKLMIKTKSTLVSE